MLNASRWILRILNWLNWGIGSAVVLVGIVIGFVIPDQFLAAARGDIGQPEIILQWFRIALPATAPMIVLVHIIFTRLIAIIDSIAIGMAFNLSNADRLRSIAWALLATQIIDLVIGLYSVQVSAQTNEYMGWSFGFTGWLAVLMLFVLARVFREGAAIREELEGTV